MALPFLNEYHRLSPNDETVVVSKYSVSAIYIQHPYVDKAYSFYRENLKGFKNVTKSGLSLRNLQLDRFFLLTDSLRSAYLSWLSKCSERYGFRGQGRSIFLTQAIAPIKNNVHRSLRYIHIINKNVLHQDHDYRKDIGITLTNEEKNWADKEMKKLGLSAAIAVSPFSVAESRMIPERKWEEILKFPLKEGYQLLLFGGSANCVACDQLINRIASNNVKSLCGKYNLRQSIALISKCEGAIATDSGLGHIAANLGLKTISIFGAGDPVHTRPIGPRARVVTENVHCSPCRKNTCSNYSTPLLCLNSIKGETVWESYCSL